MLEITSKADLLRCTKMPGATTRAESSLEPTRERTEQISTEMFSSRAVVVKNLRGEYQFRCKTAKLHQNHF